MTGQGSIARLGLVLIGAALVVGACGGGGPTQAATQAVTTTGVPATAAPPTVTPVVTPAATVAPTAAADPMDDMAIAAPYSFEPLDPVLANVFIDAMEQSMGSMAAVFSVGVRSAVQDGDTKAWVVVVEAPDLPISALAMLNGAATGAAGEEGTIEKQTIEGAPVRIVTSPTTIAALTVIGDDKLVMCIAVSKSAAVNVITAVLKANK